MRLIKVLRDESAARRTKIAESYLDHILVALAADDRGAPFRTFIDNWYAFRVGNGHLSGSDRPVWFNNPCARTHRDALQAMHFVSANARRIIDSAHSHPTAYLDARAAKDASVRLMVDHAIPLKVITGKMFAPGFQRNRGAVLNHLMRSYCLGVLTVEEDAALNRAALRSKMPDNWDGQDRFARYTVVDIA